MSEEEAEVLLDQILEQGWWNGDGWKILEINVDNLEYEGEVPYALKQAVWRRQMGLRNFPMRPEDQKVLEEGARVARARYWRGVRSSAMEMLTDAAEDYDSYEEADEYLDTRIHEEADGSIVSVKEAFEVLLHSDNTFAVEELGFERSEEFSSAVMEAAYFAFRQDLQEMVGSMSDEVTWAEDEEEEEDEDYEENPRRAALRRRLRR